MAVEAVVYDIGNVLIEWQPERYYDRVLGPERRERMFAEVDLHHMNDLVDQGGPFRETIYDWADRHPDWGDEIRAWHDNWIEMASPVIEHSLSLLRTLRGKGVPVHALSNFGIHSFAFAETQYPFLAEFDRRYISGHMGVTKPDPEIYRLVEADCGTEPGALLFVDDRADNIAEARRRGWQVHLFNGSDGWADRLVAEGLLTREEVA